MSVKKRKLFTVDVVSSLLQCFDSAKCTGHNAATTTTTTTTTTTIQLLLGL